MGDFLELQVEQPDLDLFKQCRLDGDFTLASGRKSNYFYDFDLLTPKETANYVQMLCDSIPNEVLDAVDFIAAPALGGIIPGWLFAFSQSKPFVYQDKNNELRGPCVKGGKFIVVDDVVTSFRSVNAVIRLLPDCECLGTVAYIFRGSREDLERQNYPVFYLARKEEEEEYS